MTLGDPGVGRRSPGGATTAVIDRDGEEASVRRRTDAVVAVAWLIVANKPVFPLYVWWFVGTGTATAFVTAMSAPAFLAIALFGRRHALAARLALPLVGAVDTIFATKLFGAASGCELFFVPCVLLAIVGFTPAEGRWAKGLIAVLFGGFVASHGHLGAALGPWTSAEAARLLDVVVFAVASLTAFIGWRFSGR